MKSIIKNLTPEQKDALASLAEECSSYKEACAQARDKLGIQLSPATLCRFYTTYKIADDAETRAEYCAAAGIQPNEILQLTENQLQLRLLELASRPNPGASDLRALFQIITRLQALVLSERRVVVAERRIELAEKRAQQSVQPEASAASKPPISPIEMTRFVRTKLGKSTDDLPPEPESEPAAAPGYDKEVVRWVKRLLGPEITLGDELDLQNIHTHAPVEEIKT